jgi:4-hydroxy-tetrahydrodipicolinate reductase
VIRLAQLYTGSVGCEIVRRLAGHRNLELVAVLVHSEEKEGRDSGTLAGAAPNCIITTCSIDKVLAARPEAAIYSGIGVDVDLFARLLRAGINVYSGIGGVYLRGMPEFDLLDAAGREGNASFTAGGNIPGFISDAFPVFLTGYTGRIRAIRASQRNHVSTYPSAAQVRDGLCIGLTPEELAARATAHDAGFLRSMHQPANLVADALGIQCTDVVLADKRFALAREDVVLEGSGLLVKAGTIGGISWRFEAYSNERLYLTISNEQTAALGLGPGWRESHEPPSWRVEIDGEPPLVATCGFPQSIGAGGATFLLNVSRAMNTIPRLVAAPPGCVSILDFPVVSAGDGLAS